LKKGLGKGAWKRGLEKGLGKGAWERGDLFGCLYPRWYRQGK
jgi:hypothetical protein